MLVIKYHGSQLQIHSVTVVLGNGSEWCRQDLGGIGGRRWSLYWVNWYDWGINRLSTYKPFFRLQIGAPLFKTKCTLKITGLSLINKINILLVSWSGTRESVLEGNRICKGYLQCPFLVDRLSLLLYLLLKGEGFT